MTLKRIEFYSRAAEDLSLEAVTKLAAEASRKNESRGISGWLNFDGVCFFQCMEGDEDVLDALFEAICLDRRHNDVVTLTNKSIAARAIPRWSMQLSMANGFSKSPRDAAHDGTGGPGSGGDDDTGRLKIQDLIILGGSGDTITTPATAQAIDAAGRRWNNLTYKTFVKQMIARKYGTIVEVSVAVVEMVLLANRRGPAALPNLRSFLLRRNDLVYQQIWRACENIQAGVIGRGDALDGIAPLDLASAISAVTYTVRAITEIAPARLTSNRVRRRLVNICRAALEDAAEEVSRTNSLIGSRNWLEGLVG
jgi:hypothetical protein